MANRERKWHIPSSEWGKWNRTWCGLRLSFELHTMSEARYGKGRHREFEDDRLENGGFPIRIDQVCAACRRELTQAWLRPRKWHLSRSFPLRRHGKTWCGRRVASVRVVSETDHGEAIGAIEEGWADDGELLDGRQVCMACRNAILASA